MAYRKQEFKNYTVLTAEQLNNIEAGIVEVEKSVGKCVKTINGSAPDKNGNVKIEVTGSGEGGNDGKDGVGITSIEITEV